MPRDDIAGWVGVALILLLALITWCGFRTAARHDRRADELAQAVETEQASPVDDLLPVADPWCCAHQWGDDTTGCPGGQHVCVRIEHHPPTGHVCECGAGVIPVALAAELAAFSSKVEGDAVTEPVCTCPWRNGYYRPEREWPHGAHCPARPVVEEPTPTLHEEAVLALVLVGTRDVHQVCRDARTNARWGAICPECRPYLVGAAAEYPGGAR